MLRKLFDPSLKCALRIFCYVVATACFIYKLCAKMNNLFPWQKTNSHIFFLTCHKMVFLLSYSATKKGWFMFLLQHFKQLDLFFFFSFYFKKETLNKNCILHSLVTVYDMFTFSFLFFFHILNFYYKIWFIFFQDKIGSCHVFFLFNFNYEKLHVLWILIYNLIIFTFHFIKLCIWKIDCWLD